MKTGPHILLFLLLAACSLKAQQVSSADTLTEHTMRGTYYSDRFVGRKTSSGEVFRQDRFTAAHHSYKFGTLLLVTNPTNGKQVIVRINDRCPRANIVDMTRRAAKRIGVSSQQVKVRVLPQRYYAIWEMQDQVEELAFDGLLPDFITHSDKHNNSSATPSPKATPDHETTAKPHVASQPLFNLRLLDCTSRADAERLVAQLPIYHQDNIRYLPCDNTGQYSVLLELASRRTHAENVRKQIEYLFPGAALVPFN